jgi:AcrR family transcriptional regulator
VAVPQSAVESEATSGRLSSDLILDTAAVAFAERGYRGTNLSDVAASLGVTRQAIYYYFPKKQDLLMALYVRLLDTLSEQADAVAATCDDPATRFNRMFQAHLVVVANKPTLSAIFTQERNYVSSAQTIPIRDRRRQYTLRFVNTYEAAVAAGDFRSDIPSEVAVALLLGAANWIYTWYRPGGSISVHKLADLALSFLMNGWLVGGPE